MGRSAKAGSAAGVSQMADGKDVGEANRPCGGLEGISVGGGYFTCSAFVLSY